jgi:hypothetical protein
VIGGSVSSWSWNFGDPASGANNTSTIQNPSHNFTAAGVYTVCLIATAQISGVTCLDTVCLDVTVLNPGGINSLNDENIILYPNPAEDYFTITGLETYVETLVFYDVVGRMIAEMNIVYNNDIIYLPAGITDGIYFVKMTDALGKVYLRKISINR